MLPRCAAELQEHGGTNMAVATAQAAIVWRGMPASCVNCQLPSVKFNCCLMDDIEAVVPPTYGWTTHLRRRRCNLHKVDSSGNRNRCDEHDEANVS
jgi:hypothetical protein